MGASGMKILVTGGAGFTGSAVIRQLIRETDATIICRSARKNDPLSGEIGVQI